MRRLTIGVAVALLAVGLAGCISGDGTSSEPQSTQTVPTGPTIDEPNATFNASSVYTYDAETVHEVRVENGSFSPASCFACPNSEHRYDITDMLPSGAPSLVQVDMNESDGFFSSMGVDLVTEDGQVYWENATFTGDGEAINAVVAPQGGTVEVVVTNFFPKQAPEYTLRIQVDSNRTVFPTDVPVAFTAPEDPKGLVVNATGLNESARMMLWDGEDTFLGHHPLAERTTINLTRAQGDELVGYITGARGIAQLTPVNATATEAQMRPLSLEYKEEAKSISGSNVTIEPSMERVPLQVALFLRGQNQAGGSYSGQFQGPNATLLTFESNGYYTGMGAQYTWYGDRGAEGLVPGDYLASFEFSESTGGEAGAMWLTYQR